MQKNRVLLVEDNASIQLIVQATLSPVCDLVVTSSIAEAEKEIAAPDPLALIILDVGLPDGDGFSFCQKVRSEERFQETAVIFLTGQADVQDRVNGFAIGADDYIVKPIEPMEFTARVEAKLRRKPKGMQTRLSKAGFEADLATQRVYRLGSGTKPEDLLLTPIEFRLFVHFLKNEGKVLSRKDLVTTVWGNSAHVADHTVDTHISTLRKKIGESSGFLKAVLKKGYCYTGDAKTEKK